jgi:hypothetical protein
MLFELTLQAQALVLFGQDLVGPPSEVQDQG